MNQETKDKIVDKVIALFNDYDISEIKESEYHFYIGVIFEGIEYLIYISRDGDTSMCGVFNISGDERIAGLCENIFERKSLNKESKQEKMFNKFLETEIEKLKL
jgi:hypothetical protein